MFFIWVTRKLGLFSRAPPRESWLGSCFPCWRVTEGAGADGVGQQICASTGRATPSLGLRAVSLNNSLTSALLFSRSAQSHNCVVGGLHQFTIPLHFPPNPSQADLGMCVSAVTPSSWDTVWHIVGAQSINKYILFD